MSRRAGRSLTVGRITGTATAMGLIAACAAGIGGVQAQASSQASEPAETQAGCPPQVLLLPTRTSTEASVATAINDDGWVAGWVAEPGDEETAVLWRENEQPLDLGVRGRPVDINADGDIVVQGSGSTAFLWSNGTHHRLRGTKSRPNVFVNALNDHGVVVGTVFGRRTFNARAAVWHHGRLRVLRYPAAAQPFSYTGTDINNSGLVIGGAGPRSWWRTGGRGGALSTRVGSSARALASHVDDRGRVVGFVAPRGEGDPAGPIVRWRGVHSDPKKILSRSHEVTALHQDRGWVVGQRDRRGFLAHLADDRTTLLPDPAAQEGGFPVDFTHAHDVAAGHNPYAPGGGVTVAGAVHYTGQGENGGGHRAVLWTCAQSGP